MYLRDHLSDSKRCMWKLFDEHLDHDLKSLCSTSLALWRWIMKFWRMYWYGRNYHMRTIMCASNKHTGLDRRESRHERQRPCICWCPTWKEDRLMGWPLYLRQVEEGCSGGLFKQGPAFSFWISVNWGLLGVLTREHWRRKSSQIGIGKSLLPLTRALFMTCRGWPFSGLTRWLVD